MKRMVRMAAAVTAALFVLVAPACVVNCYNSDPVDYVTDMVEVTVGKVASIVSDPLRKKPAEITVEAESGRKSVFLVDATVDIFDEAIGVVTLRDLREGQKVSVEKSINLKNGSEKVTAVKVIEQ
jgi:hypothetical protein